MVSGCNYRPNLPHVIGNMPATIDLECSACGRVHRFYLASADAFRAAGSYEYVCPSNAKTIRITISSGANKAKVKSRPRGSVEIKELN